MPRTVCFLLSLLLAVGYVGCSERRTRYISAPSEAAPTTEPPVASVIHDPWSASGGRLFDPDSVYEPWAPLGQWRTLNSRVRVWIPHWLTGYGHLIDGAINEILTVVPDGDTRIDPTWRGVDCDPTKPPVAVIIMDPYSYGLAQDIKGLTSITVAGHQTNWSRATPSGGIEEWGLLYVAWRAKQLADAGLEPRLLPALSHELRHFLTGDPFAGHPGGCCSRWVLER